MRKPELIAAIAEKTGLSKKDTAATIDQLGLIFMQQLAENQELTIPGVGKFTVKHRAARKGRHPQSGEVMDIPAKNVVHFLPIQDVRSALNAKH